MAATGLPWTMLVMVLIAEIGNGFPTIDLDKELYGTPYNIPLSDGIISSGDYSLETFDVQHLSNLNNRFALNLYKAIAANPNNRNIFFSPFSISNSLGMTYLGARGNTSQQIREALGFNDIDDLQFHKSFSDLNAMLAFSLTRTCNFRAANRIFIMDGIPLSTEFVAKARINYNTTIQNLDFVTEKRSAVKMINSWVREKTAGKIRNLIGRNEITPLTLLVLVNAVYFKADWEQQFKKKYTRPGMFYLGDKTSVEVPMMYQTGRFPFGYDSITDCNVIELPYNGRQISMVIALPQQTTEIADSLNNLEQQLNAETFHRWSMITQTEYKLDIHMPKFSLNEEVELDSILRNLGITDLFDAQHADLSGICEDTAQDLFVSKAKHQAGIVVNEDGSVAAAASAVIMSGRSKGSELNINRPFIFYIRHNPTNTILFIGRVNRPPSRSKSIVDNDVLTPLRLDYPTDKLAAARRAPPAVDERRGRSRVGKFYPADFTRY